MGALRVLLIGTGTEEAQHICAVLEHAKHAVFPVSNFAEAAEALTIQKFEAVLIAPTEATADAEPFITQIRQREKSQRNAVRLPVLSVMPAGFIATGLKPAGLKPAGTDTDALIDAVLPGGFEPAAFARTVENLANAVAQQAGTGSDAANSDNRLDGFPTDLEIFSPAEFEEQVAYDRELMVEIIDMFLEERQNDVIAMTESLAAGDLDQLTRSAHTIKGSLGSLHAHVARHRSQALETAAKDGNRQACISLLGALEQDLNDLEPQLLSLRQSVQNS
jgi:HPt (histidine-containing phosphotransfer) domain-containing protein